MGYDISHNQNLCGEYEWDSYFQNLTVDLCSNSNTSAPQSENRLTNVPLTVKCAKKFSNGTKQSANATNENSTQRIYCYLNWRAVSTCQSDTVWLSPMQIFLQAVRRRVRCEKSCELISLRQFVLVQRRRGKVTSLRISYKILWIRHTIKIPYFDFKLCHIFNHLKKQPKKKKANHKHQPLNVKVHRARLMRNTGLCLWISSRLDSTWPVTSEEVHPKSQTPTYFFG